MKKILFSALILSLLLATLTACGAEAQQPTTPEPAPQANQIEPEKPELPADPTPEPLADVKSATEPEPVADVEPEPEPAPENILIFTDCNETVYATDTVNLRSGPSTDYEKVGSLKSGDSVVRTGTGIDQFENWSRIQLADGSEVYVNNNYISTTKPVVQQSTKASGGSSTAAKPSSQSSGATSGGGGASGGSSEDANKEWAESRGQGLAGILGYDGGVPFEEGAAEGVYGDPSLRVNMG